MKPPNEGNLLQKTQCLSELLRAKKTSTRIFPLLVSLGERLKVAASDAETWYIQKQFVDEQFPTWVGRNREKDSLAIFFFFVELVSFFLLFTKNVRFASDKYFLC